MKKQSLSTLMQHHEIALILERLISILFTFSEIFNDPFLFDLSLMAFQEYFTYFQMNQSGRWTNLSTWVTRLTTLRQKKNDSQFINGIHAV